jgi:ABC-type branched-subunit amino acid transport system substrate-binding protein
MELSEPRVAFAMENTTDFSPIIRAIQATSPELVVICSYPNTSVGMVQSASELGLKPKMMGGAMVEISHDINDILRRCWT